MRVIALLVVSGSALLAQNNSDKPWVSKPFKGNFEGKLDMVNLAPTVHIHPGAGNGKGQPDGVHSKSLNTYYACIGAKDVCSDEKNVIPTRLVREFDARMAAFDAHMSDFKASLPARRSQTAGGVRPATPLTLPPQVYVLPAAAAPESKKVADELLKEIVVGLGRDEVIRKLGPPNTKVTGDFERFTYLLVSGASARIEIEAGRVTEIRMVQSN
jgi:hypothetical protein